jgi:hypothetical protein
MAERVVDEDEAHELGRDREEMAPIVPSHGAFAGQADPRLVHEGSRLERVMVALAGEAAPRDSPQFLFDERYERVERTPIPAAPVT